MQHSNFLLGFAIIKLQVVFFSYFFQEIVFPYRCQSMLVINAPLAGKLLQDYYYQHAEHASRNLHLVLVEESSVCLFD